jgi:hypothetical protein
MESRVLIPKQLSLVISGQSRREKKAVPQKLTQSKKPVNEYENNDGSESSRSESESEERSSVESAKRESDNTRSESDSNSYSDSDGIRSEKKKELVRKEFEARKDKSRPHHSQLAAEKARTDTVAVAQSYKNTIKICAKVKIEKGAVLRPSEGEIQIYTLSGVQSLEETDVSPIFEKSSSTLIIILQFNKKLKNTLCIENYQYLGKLIMYRNSKLQIFNMSFTFKRIP